MPVPRRRVPATGSGAATAAGVAGAAVATVAVPAGVAGTAAADADHNFINQIRARMWKRDAVFDDARMRLLTREDLFEKRFGLVDFSAADIGCEHVHDFADRIRRFSRAQPKDHLLFVEQICGRNRHWGRERFIGLWGKRSYPVK